MRFSHRSNAVSERVPAMNAGYVWSRDRSLILGLGLAALLLGTVPPVPALETDQYFAWCHPIADAGDAINAKLNLELQLALDEINAREHSATCEQVAARFRERLYFLIFQEVEIWVLKSQIVPRFPATAEEELQYRKQNLYHRHGPLDIGTWIPSVPTIEINHIRFGTDKLSHFVSEGWRYYRRYLRALKRDLSPAEAELRVIRIGIFWERTLLGGMSSGVFSLGDLEANYQGMLFYYGLCHGDDPVLGRRAGTWQVLRPLDLGRYITPEWDESYEVPVYAKSRWRKVQPVLVGYCDRLDCPEEVARREYYRSIDQVTATEAVIAEMIAAGKLRDSGQYTLAATCDDPDPPAPEPARPAVLRSKQPEARSLSELEQEVLQREQDRERRMVGLIGARFSNPEKIAGSFGFLWSQLPSEYDCQTLCPFQGPYLQLQPGLGGSRLGFGWARLIGEKKTNERYLSDIYLGYGFKGALLRTWGEPYRTPAGQTYFGTEAEFTIVRVNFRLGFFRHIGGGQRDDPWLLTWGLGWGF
jgi:hypothetical protein